MSGATPDPYAGFQTKSTSSVVTGDQDAVAIYNMSDAQRKELATLLKNAGYKVPTTGKQSTTIALADAYIQAFQQSATENARLGINLTPREWLQNKAEEVQGTIGASQGGASVQKTTNVLSPTEATAEINKVFQGLLGRDATPAELKTFRAELTKAEKANPTKTTYKTIGGVTTADTTGGIDREQFLTNLINNNAKLKSELNKLATTDVSVLRREKEKATFDKAIADAKGDANKIASIEATTTYGKDLVDLRNKISSYATKTGAFLDPTEIDAIAKEALDTAIDKDANTLYSFIDNKLKFTGPEGKYKGIAGQNVDDLAKVAMANGIDLQKAFGSQLPEWLSAINKGESIDTYKRIIRDVAKIGMPEKVAKLIDQGVDLSVIYSPYKNIMANTLEINPESIDMNDPTLRSAITADKEVPLYEFERALRKDDRWQYTNQARSEVSSAAQKILQDFGFMG